MTTMQCFFLGVLLGAALAYLGVATRRRRFVRREEYKAQLSARYLQRVMAQQSRQSAHGVTR